MYLINYFIYLYNFKAIYDVTGSTTGPTPVGPVVREPLPFPVLFPVRFLKPWISGIVIRWNKAPPFLQKKDMNALNAPY